MNLSNLKKLFNSYGCSTIYVKELAANDNSKNQVYLGGSFEILNVLPISEIKNEPAGEWSKERFKALIKFSWIDEEGKAWPALNSQLILYPKYPEVRFSGFLKGCKYAPSELMTTRLSGRLFFFSVSADGVVLGYVCSPDAVIAKEFKALKAVEKRGIFSVLELPQVSNNRQKLLMELYRIHLLGWIKSKRLGRDGKILPCEAPNCGGYTLEAELGISPNGYSEPDFLGWEVKQFGVVNFNKLDSTVITLMTPEPTNGLYVEDGVESFMRRYGYADLSGKEGREDRINFGGVHKAGKRQNRTGLKLELIGYDLESQKIRSTDGMIALLDDKDRVAAGWSFSSMLLHWNRKHNQACYVPSQSEKENERKYRFGEKVILGSGTDFQMFLKQMASGNVYYDPGVKMENASTKKPNVKRRSQFRIKSEYLAGLYKHSELVDLSSI